MIPSVISDGLIGAVRREYAVDPSRRHPLRLFVRGDPYELWGVIPSDVHLIGTDEGPVFLLGADRLGRDVLSRVIYGARISLSIGLVGVAISFVLGCLFGGVSWCYGGAAVVVAGAGLLRDHGDPGRSPAGRHHHAPSVTVVHELLDRERHPVDPRHSILGETALSFLGLDLRAPVVSWGVLMQDAPNFRAVAIHP